MIVGEVKDVGPPTFLQRKSQKLQDTFIFQYLFHSFPATRTRHNVLFGYRVEPRLHKAGT